VQLLPEELPPLPLLLPVLLPPDPLLAVPLLEPPFEPLLAPLLPPPDPPLELLVFPELEPPAPESSPEDPEEVPPPDASSPSPKLVCEGFELHPYAAIDATIDRSPIHLVFIGASGGEVGVGARMYANRACAVENARDRSTLRSRSMRVTQCTPCACARPFL
jgi:hypothetical protein